MAACSCHMYLIHVLSLSLLAKVVFYVVAAFEDEIVDDLDPGKATIAVREAYRCGRGNFFRVP